MSEKLLESIYENKIIAIVRGVKSNQICDTVQALEKGGINTVEITLSHGDKEDYNDSLKSLKLVKEKFGDKIILGVGTAISVEDVENAVAAGAEYIISPNVDENVIKKTKELGKISIPGAFTPSEVVVAANAGADIVKLFPAGILGIDYLKAVKGPLEHIPILSVGGVTPENICKFLEAGAKGVGIGGNLVDLKAIEKGNYKKITEIALKFTQEIKKSQ